MANGQGEFTVRDDYAYTRTSPIRWIMSHVWRYKGLLITNIMLYLVAWSAFAYSQRLIGDAAEEIINPSRPDGLLIVAVAILLLRGLDSISSLGGVIALETIAQRLARDSRQELYTSLLAKSQTFHNRQRVGDIMARSTDDVNQMNTMINPGVLFIGDTIMGILAPLLMIASVDARLLLVPFFFVAAYIFTVRRYTRRLEPVVNSQREAFGAMNAGLEETISGIEVVKASAREDLERVKFYRKARDYRDYFAKQGRVEATYLPMLFYGFALGLTFLHSVYLNRLGLITVPDIIAVMALMAILRFPVFISVFSFSLVQLGIASATRVLKIISTETEMDENEDGYTAEIQGDIRFENVSYGDELGMVLENIDFHVKPGTTLAIVGQTGSGKSKLTELINRTYDVTQGRVLIDGVDVREWSMQSLRSQISRIEQDVFLFSRTLAENIAFGAPGATQERIEQAAKEAQAHDFIMSFAEGYQTTIGERGVTLSGGQRQRIALARTFLSNPRILILDDSTSAIDSATEDEIQRAINRAQMGRTMLIITHRLSQIRWADQILVLDKGRIIGYGTHEELLQTSPEYRRIFARYDTALPPLETPLVTGD